MERLLARLERTPRSVRDRANLTMFIVGGMAITFVMLYQARPGSSSLDARSRSLALTQPWRFVSYLFLPSSVSLIWIIFSLYWTWLIGTNLENEWGSFKLNVYYLLGILGTTAAAWITGLPQTNVWLNTSLFFAFATIFPDYEILLFFVVPIRVKWLALMHRRAASGGTVIDRRQRYSTRAAIAVAIANYFLFFGAHLAALAKGQQLAIGSKRLRRAALRPPPRRSRREEGRTQTHLRDLRQAPIGRRRHPRLQLRKVRRRPARALPRARAQSLERSARRDTPTQQVKTIFAEGLIGDAIRADALRAAFSSGRTRSMIGTSFFCAP